MEIAQRTPPPQELLSQEKMMKLGGRISCGETASLSLVSVTQIISKDFTRIKVWKKGSLFFRLQAFQRPKWTSEDNQF